MNVRLHNLALAQRASYAVRELGDVCEKPFSFSPRFARCVTDDVLTAALDALTPADPTHLAAHSRPVAEVSR